MSIYPVGSFDRREVYSAEENTHTGRTTGLNVLAQKMALIYVVAFESTKSIVNSSKPDTFDIYGNDKG
jgi:hypothetical protein